MITETILFFYDNAYNTLAYYQKKRKYLTDLTEKMSYKNVCYDK